MPWPGADHGNIRQNSTFMTDAEVVRVLRDFYEGLFPKVCPNCGRQFGTLREYILATKPLWPSVDYDVEMRNFKSSRPIAGLAMANCVCGTTLALSSKEMPLAKANLILEWIQTRAIRRSLRPEELWDHLRDEVRGLVLNDAIQEASPESPRGQVPGQSPDPTPGSVTPAAGEPPRQS